LITRGWHGKIHGVSSLASWENKKMTGMSRFVPLATTVIIAACGGGGGGSSSGYTIGGNLTGLASGQHVTLQNNGADPLTLGTNGPFTFSSEVANGRSYSVTVFSGPPAQTCVVNNATGTSVNANVTTVTVNCSTNTYTVVGNLTGLASGQQVTLQNNGADPLTLTTGGTFTFSTQITYGSAYSVTVSSQPSQQFCTVQNGIGTMSGAVTNVQVACYTESVLHNFTSADSGNGAYPLGGLIMDSAGNLYGTTSSGGSNDAGVVFKLSPSTGGGYTESVLFSFPGQPPISVGAYPSGDLMMDDAGNLFGTTTNGGTGGYGVAYELSPTAGGGYTISVLHNFDGSTADGGEPTGGLIMDSAGNLYGTTSAGGAGLQGTVFRIASAVGGGYTESILYSFTGGSDGSTPEAGLIMDSAGNLYGTTSSSNTQGCGSCLGTVFKLAPAAGGSYTESTLHIFTGFDGAVPAAGLIMDSAGNLYGTTKLGTGRGGIGMGTVFKLSASGSNYSTLYSFTGGPDGARPVAGVIIDSVGNLYGTTSAGGGGFGTVFQLAPDGSGGYGESVLFSFAGGSGGAGPAANLIIDSVGNLYGTTSSGNGIGVTGIDAGNVFEILRH
jgi:uncharacterized repeat protein (TIGR03803 family)